MRLLKISTVLFLLLQICLANSPVALVTKVDGKVQSNGKPIELLSYLANGEKALVANGAHLHLSYVKGGLRATVTGPATIEVKEGEPVLVTGKPAQLQVTRPSKRVGSTLPTNLDLGSGGSLRRGEIALHLSRKIMPGEQRIEFTALPSFREFRLVVENSSSFETVYESDSPSQGFFVIPAGKLASGQSYDFLLQATSPSGSKEVKEESIAVLSEDITQRLQQQTAELQDTQPDTPETAELLALYLSYGLDREALALVEKLAKTSEPGGRLSDLRGTLRNRLQYQN